MAIKLEYSNQVIYYKLRTHKNIVFGLQKFRLLLSSKDSHNKGYFSTDAYESPNIPNAN